MNLNSFNYGFFNKFFLPLHHFTEGNLSKYLSIPAEKNVKSQSFKSQQHF